MVLAKSTVSGLAGPLKTQICALNSRKKHEKKTQQATSRTPISCRLRCKAYGLQTEDYTWLKATQAIIFIGLDIPLGYLLSRIGVYKSILIAIAFGIIGA